MTETLFFESYPPEVHSCYTALKKQLKKIGAYSVEFKKSSIHLVNAKGFAGVHPMQSYLGVNLVLGRPSTTPKAQKTERVSANRFHHFFKIDDPKQFDSGFAILLKEAYELMS